MNLDRLCGVASGAEWGPDGTPGRKIARVSDAASPAPFPFSDLPDAAQHLIISLISAKERLFSVRLASKALQQLADDTKQHAELSAVDSLLLEHLSQDGGAATKEYTLKQRKGLILKAAAKGDLRYLGLLLDTVGVPPSEWDLVAVAKTGQLGAVQLWAGWRRT
jgi:hypothetical protein